MSEMVGTSARDADQNVTGQKYFKRIKGVKDGKIDVYAVLATFDVKCPACQHAIKKLLMPGERGKNDRVNDLKEAKDAVLRAIDLALDLEQKEQS